MNASIVVCVDILLIKGPLKRAPDIYHSEHVCNFQAELLNEAIIERAGTCYADYELGALIRLIALNQRFINGHITNETFAVDSDSNNQQLCAFKTRFAREKIVM